MILGHMRGIIKSIRVAGQLDQKKNGFINFLRRNGHPRVPLALNLSVDRLLLYQPNLITHLLRKVQNRAPNIVIRSPKLITDWQSKQKATSEAVYGPSRPGKRLPRGTGSV